MPASERMHKATLAVLEGVRALLSDPANWTKDYEATDCNGNSIRAKDENARNWCLIGASMKVEKDLNNRALTIIKGTEAYKAKSAVVRGELQAKGEIRRTCIADVNDSPTTAHADILAILDEAIANARKQVTT